jgi:hypothetical protein
VNSFVYTALLLLTVGITAATTSVGQIRSKPVSPPQVEPQPVFQTDETFELNITEKRRTEENFEASTSVGLATTDPQRIKIQVGVALHARAINVLLRNVTGTVRFRGSVQRILDVIQVRQTTTSPP